MREEKGGRERKLPVFLSSYYFLGRLFAVVSFGGIPLLPSRASLSSLVTFLKLITSAPSTLPLFLFPRGWSVHPRRYRFTFSGCCSSFSFARPGKWPRLTSVCAFRLSPLIPWDLASSQDEAFFSITSLSLFLSLWFTRRRHVLLKRRCCSSRCSLNASRGTKTGERFRPHFPFSTRLPADRKRIATNRSLSTTTQAARSRVSVARRSILRFFDGQC